MDTSNASPWLHKALAQHFIKEELVLLCVDAGINPESVPFAVYGIELYAYCVVETCRRHNHILQLITACIARDKVIDWHACRIADTAPLQWLGFSAPLRAIDDGDDILTQPQIMPAKKSEQR